MTDKSSYYAKAKIVVHPPVRRRRHRAAVTAPAYVSKDDEPTDADDAEDSFLACDTKKQNERTSRELLRRLIEYHGDADDRLFYAMTKSEA